jgi:DNA-binding response OmpR family regulator
MSKKPIKVLLLVEDNQGDARLLQEMLNERSMNGTEVSHVTTMSDAESHLGMHVVDIIVLDLGLPDTQGVEAIRRAHAAAPHIPLVVLTGRRVTRSASAARRRSRLFTQGTNRHTRAVSFTALCH